MPAPRNGKSKKLRIFIKAEIDVDDEFTPDQALAKIRPLVDELRTMGHGENGGKNLVEPKYSIPAMHKLNL